jgi:8-oxo-dGTP pyrophosphatase MutT (NUDIX family)
MKSTVYLFANEQAGMLKPEIVRQRLALPRDARNAWGKFAPELTYGRHRMPPPCDARLAAVLVLLYQDDGVWRLPLIERPPDITVHSGQVCFPGGRTELGETPEDTAVREFEEELGASPVDFELCGQLTPMYIYASNFFVTPCVAFAERRPHFIPNPLEVANLLEPPLVHLSEPERVGSHQIERRGLVFRAPHIAFEGRRIWGATSMMLAELFEVLLGVS